MSKHSRYVWDAASFGYKVTSTITNTVKPINASKTELSQNNEPNKTLPTSSK